MFPLYHIQKTCVDNGAIFESTLNPETRRAGRMHDTSIENIPKLIDPLFLDRLKTEFAEIKTVTVKCSYSTALLYVDDQFCILKLLCAPIPKPQLLLQCDGGGVEGAILAVDIVQVLLPEQPRN